MVCPAAKASRRRSAGLVLLAARSVISSGCRPARRAISPMRSFTFCKPDAIVVVFGSNFPPLSCNRLSTLYEDSGRKTTSIVEPLILAVKRPQAGGRESFCRASINNLDIFRLVVHPQGLQQRIRNAHAPLLTQFKFA